MHPRTIKSYVLRAGRVSNRQQHALDNWLPLYSLPQTEELWDLNNHFTMKGEVVVEIGFGMGDSLLRMAKENPALNFIGIEVHQAGIGALVAGIHEAGLHNIRIASFDAVEVFKKYLPDNSLQGIQIFFPDPWPKKRHHKRRLVQRDFIKTLVKKIKPGGFIHCATDWEEYAHHMLDVLEKEEQLKNQQIEGGFTPKPPTRPLTKFEKRGEQLGHGVWDLIFFKVI
ncbi:tRNA (m7G46) methyltransferase, SAM-dependent (plasmid) [Legionella adelaidensis]|uniref:tRNA (guanine-N(7)-)-methyltransferase n=1 Tax=Legionella adelaidensis TaxID=45056 RepID=A0A0W0R2X3_9GAMM|nr:tRNA (guanosine(46)-N7)-methyltransferase TrmB [Legionella adelaidensis]KTC65385.1 tRNA (m7G46) methyltransferase, SAM-dependent [Legionella adelaidensis]VEH84793.1 tRNA (m7G46) methyltransferase, SAM-dependent [Legionella adelaidensis]